MMCGESSGQCGGDGCGGGFDGGGAVGGGVIGGCGGQENNHQNQ